MPVASSNIDYLIDGLRLMLGDTDSDSYRYTDEWLRTALVMAVKALMKWWNYKYLIDEDNEISRNPNFTFLFASPPILEYGDETAIQLMAAIIIAEGSLEESAWNTGSWRDAEIAYSNIEGAKQRDSRVKAWWDRLNQIVTPPGKRLAQPIKGSLPGYLNNEFERNTEY